MVKGGRCEPLVKNEWVIRAIMINKYDFLYWFYHQSHHSKTLQKKKREMYFREREYGRSLISCGSRTLMLENGFDFEGHCSMWENKEINWKAA